MATTPQNLVIELLSDAAIASGLSTPGSVDTEVVHDDVGLPYIRGTVIHGLLRDSWLSMRHHFPDLEEVARDLLGQEGDHSTTGAVLRVGDALLPWEVRQWAHYAVHRENNRNPLRPQLILKSLTDVRRQTAQSRETGGPDEHTLRATRVVLRGLSFYAPLQWLAGEPPPKTVQCLALCALGTRHLGLGRNRGLGFACVTLDALLERTQEVAGGDE
jgi:hypothetical protein